MMRKEIVDWSALIEKWLAPNFSDPGIVTAASREHALMLESPGPGNDQVMDYQEKVRSRLVAS